MGSIDAPTVLTRAEELENARRLALASEPELVIDASGKVGDAATIRFISTLPNGTVVLLREGGEELERYEQDGTESRLKFGEGREASAVFQAGPDTLIVLLDEWWVLRLSATGVVIDSAKLDGRLMGVLRDGALVVRRSGYRDRYSIGDGFEFLPSYIDLLLPSVSLASFERRHIFTGGSESHEDAGLVPWSWRMRALVGGGALWISPTGTAELIRMSSDGRLARRVRWDSADTMMTQTELAEWRAHEAGRMGLRGDSAAAEQDARLAQLATLEPQRQVPVIDRLLAGPDASVWVRRRVVAHGRAPDSVYWLGFDSVGTLIGRLEVPSGVDVVELSASHALVQTVGEWDRVRRVRLVTVDSVR